MGTWRNNNVIITGIIKQSTRKLHTYVMRHTYPFSNNTGDHIRVMERNMHIAYFEYKSHDSLICLDGCTNLVPSSMQNGFFLYFIHIFHGYLDHDSLNFLKFILKCIFFNLERFYLLKKLQGLNWSASGNVYRQSAMLYYLIIWLYMLLSDNVYLQLLCITRNTF